MKILTKHSVFGFILGGLLIPALFIAWIFIYFKYFDESPTHTKQPPQLFHVSELDYDWSVKNLDGEEIIVSDIFDDRVVFLNFWATWCGPCVYDMPEKQIFYDNFKDRIAFAFVSKEDTDKISGFIEENGYSLPVFSCDSIPVEFNVSGIPAHFIISKGRKIKLYATGGGIDWNHESVTQFLEELIAE